MNSSLRRPLVLALVFVLVLALAVSPAIAAKKKKGSFAAENLPFPSGDGCLAGEEGVHKTTQPLKVPFSGVLTVTMVDFDGDWDLFVTDPKGTVLVEATASQLTGDPPEEEVILSVKAKQKVAMVACNWLGGLSATVNWELAG